MFSDSPVPIDEQDTTGYQVRVLLVDDQPFIIEAVRRVLAEYADIDFHAIGDAKEALATAQQVRPTVILQDLLMPGSDGFELLRTYRADEILGKVPVIVLSAKEEAKLKALAFAIGADDYIVKLPDPLELVARIRHHSARYISRLQRDAAYYSLRESQQQLARANEELSRLARLDALTGIANRRSFDEAARVEWQRCRRHQSPLALLLCDVDYFKLYNDHFGHPAGDLCLKKVAALLTNQLKRPADLAARYGGEEFAILLPDTDLAGAMLVAEGCRARLEQEFMPHPMAACGQVTMSIGVASVIPAGEDILATLIARADAALYAAKTAGRNRVSPPFAMSAC